MSFIPHGVNDEALPFDLDAQVMRVQDNAQQRRGVACTFPHLSHGERLALKAFLKQVEAVR